MKLGLQVKNEALGGNCALHSGISKCSMHGHLHGEELAVTWELIKMTTADEVTGRDLSSL